MYVSKHTHMHVSVFICVCNRHRAQQLGPSTDANIYTLSLSTGHGPRSSRTKTYACIHTHIYTYIHTVSTGSDRLSSPTRRRARTPLLDSIRPFQRLTTATSPRQRHSSRLTTCVYLCAIHICMRVYVYVIATASSPGLVPDHLACIYGTCM